MSTLELDGRIKELRELRRMADELDAQIEAITDSVKREMYARNVDTLAGTDWKATWKEVTGKRFDKAAAITLYGQDFYDRLCKPVTTRRFVLA